MQFSWLTFSTGLRSCWHTFHYGLSSLFFWRSLRVMLSFASEETLRFTDVRFLWAKCPKYSVKAWSYCFARSITFCCSQMVLRCCNVVACNSSSRTIIPGEPNLTQVAVSQRNRLIQWETKINTEQVPVVTRPVTNVYIIDYLAGNTVTVGCCLGCQIIVLTNVLTR